MHPPGIPVGAYYYTYAQNEAARAVELVKVKQALMGKSFQLPVLWMWRTTS